ncbi:MAG: sulfate adenylyltransferase subunit CysD [Pseudomonadales bacterium]|nr:sulfate adenylyltransferase subunit CysD [Pseudomonadales bacterium]MBO7004778.1 sulfate adenylyltransferase subunit CysD [Pseudomonadales bacterium]
MDQLPDIAFTNPSELWDAHQLLEAVNAESGEVSQRTLERAINSSSFLPPAIKLSELRDETGNPLNELVRQELENTAKKQRQPSLLVQAHKNDRGFVLMANDGRQGRKWRTYETEPTSGDLESFLQSLAADYARSILVWPQGALTKLARKLAEDRGAHTLEFEDGSAAQLALTAYANKPIAVQTKTNEQPNPKTDDIENSMDMTHLDRLEAESMHIIREVMAEAENPVMLYSIGKDSAVMLRLAEKAFYPSKPPFPLLHVDTRWKFQEMYKFRSWIAEQTGMELLVHINPEGVEKNINPFDHGSALHTDIMKTQGLKQALDLHRFDVAFGGARRDEEKSRAKERVFSFRTDTHRWDPKNQRPELWNLYNGRKNPGESIRVFPLSNWTELDIWQYIYKEDIPIVPLYYAAERPVIERDGMLMMVDDDRLKLFPGEKIQTKRVRFRTLGCYPLTGAIESDADDLPKILLELLEARTSERQGRAIDKDSAGSMEKKKQEGYF